MRRGGKKYGGTAFFVSELIGLGDWHAVYVVTARHCIVPLDIGTEGPFESITLRLNTLAGGSDTIETNPDDWFTHPVADAALLQLKPDEIIFDYLHWPIRSSATREFMDEKFFGPGEEVFITGLLTYHPGGTRILPIVRVGNIAALTDEPVRLKTGDDVATLIEVRSIGGLSGSPAFLHMPEFRRNREGNRESLPIMADPPHAVGGPNRLLGIVHGFPLVGDENAGGKFESLNSGITVVVPVERIIELIESPELTKVREDVKVLIDTLKLDAESAPVEGQDSSTETSK